MTLTYWVLVGTWMKSFLRSHLCRSFKRLQAGTAFPLWALVFHSGSKAQRQAAALKAHGTEKWLCRLYVMHSTFIVSCLCTSENGNKGHRTKGNVLPHLLSACLCVFHNPFRLRVKRNICTASILSPLTRTQLLTAVNACWCYKAHSFNPLSLCWLHIHTQREQQVRSPAHYHGNQTHLSARVSPALFKHTEPITELYLLWLNFDW